MTTIGKHIYSKKEFEGYRFRAAFRLKVSEDWREDTTINIYTDNSNREEVNNVIVSKTTDKVVDCTLENWATKEQDELATELIEETLKGL